jgi:hypothetical protein
MTKLEDRVFSILLGGWAQKTGWRRAVMRRVVIPQPQD